MKEGSTKSEVRNDLQTVTESPAQNGICATLNTVIPTRSKSFGLVVSTAVGLQITKSKPLMHRKENGNCPHRRITHPTVGLLPRVRKELLKRTTSSTDNDDDCTWGRIFTFEREA